MLIDTKYLGKLEIKEDKIIHFESGLPGFLDETKFVLLDIPGNDLLQLLQSVQTPNLAFFVANPHYFYKEYSFALDETIMETLHINDQKEIVILSIMTIHEPFHLSTINLQAPIIINSTKMYGKQFILKEETYSLKAKISLPTGTERGE